MTVARTELDPDTVAGYLRDRQGVPHDVDPSVRSLGGGVSNTVLAVRWDGNCLVLKQPLANLAVEDDWLAEVSRVHNEASAVQAFRRLLGDADLESVTVPAVRFEDDANHIIGLECAPTGTTMWKRELLDGRIDITVARSLGHALGVVHERAADEAPLSADFDDPTPFEQLRLDPYHRTVAERHPELAEPILAEADRVAGADQTLVHGDYSPKNVLVDRTATPPVLWLIDFEVAHWGDPAFDVAFMANHLFIKALYVADHRDRLIGAAATFWEAYRDAVPWTLEADVVAELGVLMLARIDGKSPVEYVAPGPVAEAMRRVARLTLRNEVETMSAYADIVREAGP